MDSSKRPSPESLGEIGIFGGLDSESLSILSTELELRTVDPGQVVVNEGDTDAEMFVVIYGELEVMKKAADGRMVRVALFGPGDWLGDMSGLDVQPRSATVRSLAQTHMLVMSSHDVRHHLYERDAKAYAIFVMNVARELSRRLRVANGLLSQVMLGISGSMQP